MSDCQLVLKIKITKELIIVMFVSPGLLRNYCENAESFSLMIVLPKVVFFLIDSMDMVQILLSLGYEVCSVLQNFLRLD